MFVTSHPIQYQAPVFRELASMSDLDFQVMFAMVPDAETQGEGFGVGFEWDIPLLHGYRYRILKNVATSPSVTKFEGCDTPSIGMALKTIRPDAVIVNGWVVKTCIQALWACKRLSIPCMVRGEANDLRNRPAWKRILQRFLVRQYAACLFIGSANRAFYRSRGVPDANLFFAPYCVENERFERAIAASAGQREALRDTWSIPQKSTCYLYCGKFEEKKHPVQLLQALRVAANDTSSIHLLMVGDGQLRGECERFVARHRLPVSFAGFLNQEQIAGAYLAADCLVLPSDEGETWGLVVNEAMACGRPALVSDLVGCSPDLLKPGETGDIFEFGDWDGLARLLIHHAHPESRLEQMGRAAYQHIQAYSPKVAARGIRRSVIEKCAP